MPIEITGVSPHSPAATAGIAAGDLLCAINGHPIRDVLDYDFYQTEKSLSVTLQKRNISGEVGEETTVSLKKGQYTPLGLEFPTFLMDRQQRCANRCIFCFIDQLPENMRESLYFKDDDVRLSFLLGNYVTMTNFTSRDVERILEMKLSPINISVHTTDPALRVAMLRNKRAGEVLSYLSQFTSAGITIHCQIVVCPGWNDGEALEKTFHDLIALGEKVESIAVVPVGLTDHREGLTELEPVSREKAEEILEQCARWNRIALDSLGQANIYPSDEFYLLAEKEIPSAEEYGEYPQLENGVGMLRLLEEEFTEALEDVENIPPAGSVTIATGKAAAPWISSLAERTMALFPQRKITVYPIENRTFGSRITVTGLVAGKDILAELQNHPLGERLVLSRVMLRAGEQVFLDDMTVEELSEKLQIPVTVTENNADGLLSGFLGVEENAL